LIFLFMDIRPDLPIAALPVDPSRALRVQQALSSPQ
jgi:hypothetical protein